MGFPIGNAIIYQGFTLLVNKFFGSASVITYNTTRAMCNFMRQLLATVQHAIWPEYSIAYGKSDITRMRLLHRKVFKYSNGIGLIISLFILIFGTKIYETWTQHMAVFDWSIMLSFLIIINVENIWTSSSICLVATNKHSKLGVLYVLFSLLSISLAFIMSFQHINISVIVLNLLIIHIPLSIYALRYAWNLTEDSFFGFFKSMSIKI
jgi:O-antigen/teichoic acid export membrane protein